MRYTINYSGAFFYKDNEEFNSHEVSSFDEGMSMLYALHEVGYLDAYLRDEKYGCSLRYDARTNELVWD